MKLRKLEKKDAEYMLEWMHDKDTVQNLLADFESKTIEDCVAFIEDSRVGKDDAHMAITDENDVYMGTVSLKNIDHTNRAAEFAIAIRKCAMGKGYAKEAMKEIIEYAFGGYRLDSVYWCVNQNNARALRFYDKNGYGRVKGEDIRALVSGRYTAEQIQSYIWYMQKKIKR